jgi:hypothetical protein
MLDPATVIEIKLRGKLNGQPGSQWSFDTVSQDQCLPRPEFMTYLSLQGGE